MTHHRIGFSCIRTPDSGVLFQKKFFSRFLRQLSRLFPLVIKVCSRLRNSSTHFKIIFIGWKAPYRVFMSSALFFFSGVYQSLCLLPFTFPSLSLLPVVISSRLETLLPFTSSLSQRVLTSYDTRSVIGSNDSWIVLTKCSLSIRSSFWKGRSITQVYRAV